MSLSNNGKFKYNYKDPLIYGSSIRYASKPVSHTIVMLHGYGGNINSMCYYINYLNNNLEKHFNIKYIVPQAPHRKISCYNASNNASNNAWYDYFTDYCNKEENINNDHVETMDDKLKTIMDREVDDYSKVYLLGYSQGACQALYTGISFPETLGGIMSFRGHIITNTPNEINQHIWAYHGKQDDIIGFNVAEKSYKKYAKHLSIDFHRDEKLDHCKNSRKEMNSCLDWLTVRLTNGPDNQN